MEATKDSKGRLAELRFGNDVVEVLTSYEPGKMPHCYNPLAMGECASIQVCLRLSRGKCEIHFQEQIPFCTVLEVDEYYRAAERFVMSRAEEIYGCMKMISGRK